MASERCVNSRSAVRINAIRRSRRSAGTCVVDHARCPLPEGARGEPLRNQAAGSNAAAPARRSPAPVQRLSSSASRPNPRPSARQRLLERLRSAVRRGLGCRRRISSHPRGYRARHCDALGARPAGLRSGGRPREPRRPPACVRRAVDGNPAMIRSAESARTASAASSSLRFAGAAVKAHVRRPAESCVGIRRSCRRRPVGENNRFRASSASRPASTNRTCR
jgi:hypothetical protein